MKSSIMSFLILLTVTSCYQIDKLDELESRITNLEKRNNVLVDSLNFVTVEFVKPFKIYEKIVLSEFKRSPNQIISDYESLIENYPNSFWKHEAKKRIENIEERKKYWSETEGWKFPEESKRSKFIKITQPMIISCPGC